MARTNAQAVTSETRITDEQRRTLFALGCSHGFDRERLRELTPGGRISMLTETEAAELIDRLRGRPAVPRAFRGTAGPTDGQLAMIEHLADVAGFHPGEFQSWLHRWFGIRGVAHIPDRTRAGHVIAALRRIREHGAELRGRRVERVCGAESSISACR